MNKLLPVINKYIAKIEVWNQLNIFVFESGVWSNVGLELIDPSELMELYLVARFHGLFLSSLRVGWSNEKSLVGLKRVKKAKPNPSKIKNKTTKKGKTSLATPIIIAKYFPYDENTRKNSKNLKINNKIAIEVIWRDELPSISQIIDVIIGKEHAPISINKKKH